MDPDTLCRSGSRHGLSALNRKGVKKAVLLGELGVIYFPTNGGAKEPQNLPNHRVDKNLFSRPLVLGALKADDV